MDSSSYLLKNPKELRLTEQIFIDTRIYSCLSCHGGSGTQGSQEAKPPKKNAQKHQKPPKENQKPGKPNDTFRKPKQKKKRVTARIWSQRFIRGCQEVTALGKSSESKPT